MIIIIRQCYPLILSEAFYNFPGRHKSIKSNFFMYKLGKFLSHYKSTSVW